ncbi:hypothetical protein GuL6_032 [Buttiauxella phage vB_ButM_GuL6]|nr:hypothetical protein GuL6_032 [Buttiauxella phage vB_ButM_GuL6]
MKLAIAFILLVLNALMGFPFSWLVLLAIPFAWNLFRIAAAGFVLVLMLVIGAMGGKDAFIGVLKAAKDGLKEGLVK